MELELPVFRAYRGNEPPRFASPAELECAKVLDYYDVAWEYEPRTFVLEEDENGRVIEAFTPDFYLPEQELYVEITAMKQSLVTRKNRKLRKLRERYPDVKIKLFYRRDLERLAQHFHLDLAGGSSGRVAGAVFEDTHLPNELSRANRAEKDGFAIEFAEDLDGTAE